jgi:hypothetical protein
VTLIYRTANSFKTIAGCELRGSFARLRLRCGERIKYAIAALFLVGWSQSSPTLTQVSVNAIDWGFFYSVGMPAHPTQTGNGWSFDFPQNTAACPGPMVVPGPSNCPQVDYILTASPVLKPNQTVSMSATIATSGNPQFNYFTQNDGSQSGKQASYSERRHGFGCGVSGASITRRWRARSP